MEITINEHYKLTTDALNFILNEKRMVDPTKSPNWKKREAEGASPDPYEKWTEVSYHSSIEDALSRLIDRVMRQSDATEVTQLFREVADLKTDIRRVLKEFKAV